MEKDGFVEVIAFLNHPYLVERKTTRGDLETIAKGSGGNNKGRFEFGTLMDQRTLAIRATQGHSRGDGVEEDSLPITTDVVYLVLGTTLSAAQSVAKEGINRGERAHVHFYNCNREGGLMASTQSTRCAQVVIVVSGAHAKDEGIVLYKSSNNVALSAGANGFILPRYIRSVFSIPDMKLLRPSVGGVWRIAEPVQGGNAFGENSDYGDDIPDAPQGLVVPEDQSLFDIDAEGCFDEEESSVEKKTAPGKLEPSRRLVGGKVRHTQKPSECVGPSKKPDGYRMMMGSIEVEAFPKTGGSPHQ